MDNSHDDWEILQPILLDSSFPPIQSNHNHQTLIRPDYFSLDSNLGSSYHPTYSDLPHHLEGIQDLGCGENFKQVSLEVACSEGSFDQETSDFGQNPELGCQEISERIDVQVGMENFGGQLVCGENGDSGVMENSGGQLVCGEDGDGGVIEKVTVKSESSRETGAVNELGSNVEANKMIVWWKLPFEILKFCVFRVSPVWSISIAAAVVGYVILKKRLYMMRQKSRSLPIKLTVEDNKVSQFMTRAARLNDAFSIMKRVTTIRPLLPAPGVTPWPLLNLR